MISPTSTQPSDSDAPCAALQPTAEPRTRVGAYPNDPQAVSELLSAALAERDAARVEVEALRRDRAWEINRANEAARLSADARDRADDLNRVIADLREHLSIVEDDRTACDAWALNVLAENGIDFEWGDLLTPISDALREARAEVVRLSKFAAGIETNLHETPKGSP